MRLDVLTDDEGSRIVGAAVVRSAGKDVWLEIGPADGAPLVRLRFAPAEVHRVAAALKAVAAGKNEEIILAED